MLRTVTKCKLRLSQRFTRRISFTLENPIGKVKEYTNMLQKDFKPNIYTSEMNIFF